MPRGGQFRGDHCLCQGVVKDTQEKKIVFLHPMEVLFYDPVAIQGWFNFIITIDHHWNLDK